MNIVLFEPAELATPLPRTDPRAAHVLGVLRRGPGDLFDAGIVNGPRGKASIVEIREDHLSLCFAWDPPPTPSQRTILVIGLPRPQTARDVLRDATTLGATGLHFVATERADRNYAASSLWTSGEWRRHCVTGAAQAFDTRIPDVTWTHTLAACLDMLPDGPRRLALDNYESNHALRERAEPPSDLIIALGPERGWGDADRTMLRDAGFELVHLGRRVLRLETAVVAALAITRAA